MCPSSKASDPSLSRETLINTVVRFAIACAGGDVQGTSSHTAWLYIHRMFKNGGKVPPLVGDVSAVMRKVGEEVTRGS